MIELVRLVPQTDIAGPKLALTATQGGDEGRRYATRVVRFQRSPLGQRMERWNLSVYDPLSKSWTVHRLPGDEPHTYAVYVDDKDKVWVSDFGANAILSFDPTSEEFETFVSDKPDAAVRQLNGRAGEVWGAESGADRLVVIRATGKEAGD